MVTETVPVLDCSTIAGPFEKVVHTEDFAEFTKKLGKGMKEIGFVYFINHGLDDSTLENVLNKSKQFFELPAETKQKYRKMNPLENFNGFTAAEDEVADERNVTSVRDLKECYDFCGPDAHDESCFPVEVRGFKAAVDDFKEALTDLGRKVFRSFAVILELDDLDFFIKKHQAAFGHPEIPSHNDVRTNYYQAQGSEVQIGPETYRLSEHQDWGTITFLIQDALGGLEAKTTAGEWITVPPIPGSIVFNAGLMLEMWSGGHFPATPHRVRLLKNSANKVRQSIGYFVQPDGNAYCMPLVPEHPAWKPMYPKVDKETHYEYFKERIRNSRATAY